MELYLIEILHQTTTVDDMRRQIEELYLIEILHQTTTLSAFKEEYSTLYLIEILHQTTTRHRTISHSASCILSKFYIKPQPASCHPKIPRVVSYRNSTSNHNNGLQIFHLTKLYLIEILHQTTTVITDEQISLMLYLIEILHQTTTLRSARGADAQLYLIEILHQTTTSVDSFLFCYTLYLIEILHQTTTSGLILIDKVLLTGCLPL